MSASSDKDAGPPSGAGDASAEPELLVELNALLGRGTRYSGKLHFDGRVRIEGQFSGEIRGDDVLVIGHGAEVDAEIDVGVCIVTGGKVRANIRAREAIELHVPAMVEGELHAPNIFIDRGVQFEGKCKMAPLDELTAEPEPVNIVAVNPLPEEQIAEDAASEAADIEQYEARAELPVAVGIESIQTAAPGPVEPSRVEPEKELP